MCAETLRGQKRTWEPLELETLVVVRGLMWMLGPELRSLQENMLF